MTEPSFSTPGLYVGLPPEDKKCCGDPLRHVIAESEKGRVEGWQCLHCGRIWYTDLTVSNMGDWGEETT